MKSNHRFDCSDYAHNLPSPSLCIGNTMICAISPAPGEENLNSCHSMCIGHRYLRWPIRVDNHRFSMNNYKYVRCSYTVTVAPRLPASVAIYTVWPLLTHSHNLLLKPFQILSDNVGANFFLMRLWGQGGAKTYAPTGARSGRCPNSN
jgi:hypothetical protein